MLATLPMYDWPEVMADQDRFWAGLSRHAGLDVGLSRLDDFTAAWHRPDMVFSQTCGYPFTHHFKGKLKLVATPHYDAPGCDGPSYSSFILAREQKQLADFKGAKAAVNTEDSMSGMLALKAVFQPYSTQGRLFGEAKLSGGHALSMKMVQRQEADVCAIDAVCVEMARRYRPALLEGLVEIARSPSVPGLPFVSIAGDVARLQEALAAAFEDPALDEVRARLLLKGFSLLDVDAYNAIPALEDKIEAGGGLKLL
jgi:ABC-type phosphate/phosphonate transport system substrate-binding protein